MVNIFVYATLMSGGVNHNMFLKGQEFFGKAHLNGYVLYYLGWYPGGVKSCDKNDRIKEEVYRVDDNTIRQIDYLEGNGDLYIRKIEPVQLGCGTTMEAYVYEYQKSILDKERVNYCQMPWN